MGDLSATRSKLRIRIRSVIARRDEGAGAAICHIMQLGLYGQISPLRTYHAVFAFAHKVLVVLRSK
jgi:hypothetical protein